MFGFILAQSLALAATLSPEPRVLAAPPGPPAPRALTAKVPDAAQFGDWSVACDNIRYCEILAADGNTRALTLYVSRMAPGTAQPTVEVYRSFADGIPAAAYIEIDGRRSDFAIDSEGNLIGPPAAFLAALAKANSAQAIGSGGKVLGAIPVMGASAALRWMDDRQERADTVTAIVAKGARPATSVPPPPPLPEVVMPEISDAPPQQLSAQAVRDIRAISDYCDDDREIFETHRLDAKHTVGLVFCFLAAYQGPHIVVVIDEDGGWEPASIEQPSHRAEFEPNSPWRYMLTTADYNSEDRLLTFWSKGRGLADCGSSGSWAWDGEVFRLTAWQELEPCRGAPPGLWLSRWQTANDPLDRSQ